MNTNKEDAVRIHANTDENALLDMVRARQPGWNAAASLLLQRYERDLLRRCTYRLSNATDAEDAVQETLFRAYRAIHGFEGKSSFRTWLFIIADNQCHTLAGRRARHTLSEHVRMLIEIHEQGTRSLHDFDEAVQVQQALNALPANAKRVLRMRYFMDLSLEDIAHNLGIGLSAAKMRLYRAHDTFRDTYEAGMMLI